MFVYELNSVQYGVVDFICFVLEKDLIRSVTKALAFITCDLLFNTLYT